MSECELGTGLLRGRWVTRMKVLTPSTSTCATCDYRSNSGGIEPRIIATLLLQRATLCSCLQSPVK